MKPTPPPRRSLCTAVWLGALALLGPWPAGGASAAPGPSPARDSAGVGWKALDLTLSVRHEVTGVTEAFPANALPAAAGSQTPQVSLPALGLTVTQHLRSLASGEAWELAFAGEVARAGHEVVLEIRHLLRPGMSVFTPSQKGVMDLACYPSFQPPAYATLGWETGQAYVLPLVTPMDERADRAWTIALPADVNLPHLQFQWTNASVLRVTLSHRAMGGGRVSPLQLLLFTHAADYRAALRAYSDAFPRHFRSPLPPSPHEGAFYYHHIQDHPPFEEMQRQNVRQVWTSFWFTHLGEYLPDAAEWEPYTYAKWWKLGQTMTDERINTFIRDFHARGVGVHAYFNVTEYGGAGGKTGDTAPAARRLREEFADALVKDAAGHDLPTWEGALAMNPGRAYSLWPFLVEQVQRHLRRLPEFDGFVIDRLDWASVMDYGHDDGRTMFGARPAANLAEPIGEAIREIARLSHAAGKRVLVNQFYRIEPLADVDGYCHENDYLPALAYLSPYRFACAWHHRVPYQGDLLPFEGQLKRRLHYALLPQMIAHAFPIAQQEPNAAAADLLELYAPLFAQLAGKEQVLQPHCVEAEGANEVNLYRTATGRYVLPVTSRLRFLTRGQAGEERIRLTLRVADAPSLRWAQVYSVEAPPTRVRIRHRAHTAQIILPAHRTASVVVAGFGPAPALPETTDPARRQALHRALGSRPRPPARARAAKPQVRGGRPPLVLQVEGTQLCELPGITTVEFQGRLAGELLGTATNLAATVPFDWTASEEPTVTFHSGDEGTWFVPTRIQLLLPGTAAARRPVAEWTAGDRTTGEVPRTTVAHLRWCAPQPTESARQNPSHK